MPWDDGTDMAPDGANDAEPVPPAHNRGMNRLPLLLAYLVLLGPPSLASAALTEEEMFFKGTANVNEGQLHFLDKAPDTPVHHHQNLITLTDDSIATGWGRLEQCHSHIDAVPSSQVVYSRDRIRDLRVVRADNIGRAWVQENTVQMENVGHDAVLCVEADTRALAPDGQNGYVLRNGPYMRRFLDGYYPMRVSMTVRLAAPRLRYVTIEPAPQTGFQVNVDKTEVRYETVFEGKLRTVIHFDLNAGATMPLKQEAGLAGPLAK